MKLRQRKEKMIGEQLPLDKQVKENPTSLKLRRAKEAEGSRWAALVLLIMTLVFCFWFYVQGTGGWQKVMDGFESVFAGWGGESTYVFEKE